MGKHICNNYNRSYNTNKIVLNSFLKKENYMNNYYVYLHIDPRTNEINHVGKGKLGRAYSFSLKRRYGKNRKWISELKSLSLKPIVKFVKKCLSEQEAFELEKETISKLKDSGINLNNETLGGKGVLGRSFSKESLIKLSKSLKGKPSGMIGKKHSDEAKKKMSLSQLKYSKLSSERARKRMLGPDNPMRGKVAHNKGSKHTDEAKLKMSLSKKGKVGSRLGHSKYSVKCVDTINNEVLIFKSVYECADFIGSKYHSIKNHIRREGILHMNRYKITHIKGEV